VIDHHPRPARPPEGVCGPACTEPSSFLPPPSPPALSLPSKVALGVRTVFRLPSGYCAPVLDLPGHRVSFLRCTAYRLRGTRQISTGKIQQTSRPSRPHYACTFDENRASPLPADSPDADALRSFAFARNGRAPMTSTRPPLAGSPGLRHWKGPGIPDQRPCLLGVGFPSSGPRVWTFTSCLLVMPFAPGRLGAEPLPDGPGPTTLVSEPDEGKSVKEQRITEQSWRDADRCCSTCCQGS